jgi:stearoyl-CoA desaturase (delta-9 desaturase)
VKSLWINTCLICFIVGAAFATSLSAIVVFVVFTYLSLLLGHSVGMHRKLIHRTYECPKPLERFLVYLGVIVGMAGPLGLIRVHDIRDWAQRERIVTTSSPHREAFLEGCVVAAELWFEFEAATLNVGIDRRRCLLPSSWNARGSSSKFPWL